MATKTIELSKSASSSNYIQAKIVCYSSANHDTNKSDVTCKLYVRKGHYSTTLTVPTSGTWSYSMSINGKAFSGTVSKDVLLDWVLVATESVNGIAHNDDGTKSIAISGSVTAPAGTTLSGHRSSGSGTAAMDTVPRASSITSASDVTLGNSCSVKWVPASASFRYKLKFTLGNWSHTTAVIHPNKTSAYTYTGYPIPMEVANQIPNAYTGMVTVTLYTYSDSEGTSLVGSDSDEFKITAPSSIKPVVSMTVSPVHSLPAAFDGIFVQGLSKVKASMSAETLYGASVRYYDVAVEGKTYGLETSYTSDFLTGYGKVDVVGHAVDSRSYGGYVWKEINIVPYTKPKIQNVSVERCDEDGNLMDSGTYLKISAKRSYSYVLADGVQKNFCCIRFRHKTKVASSWSEWVSILDGDDLSADEVTTDAMLGTILVTSTYLVQVQVVDTIGMESTATITVPTDSVYMHRSGAMNSMGLGKYAEKSNTLDTAWSINTEGGLTVAGNSIIGGTVSAADIGRIGYYRNLDFNTLTKHTGYYVDSSAPAGVGCSNYPVNVTGMLSVIAYGGAFAYQTYRTYDGDIYTRSYYSGTGWTDWKQVQLV